MSKGECDGCLGTGEITYCTRCNYHADDCKCDRFEYADTYENMECPSCEGTGIDPLSEDEDSYLYCGGEHESIECEDRGMIQEAPKPTPYMLRWADEDYYIVCSVERRGMLHIVYVAGRVFM